MNVAYVLMAIIVVALLALMRNKRVYQIRMAILHEDQFTAGECNDHYDLLPSYDYMFFHPTQWYMWTAGQYKRRYC